MDTERKSIPETLVDFHVHLFPAKGFDAIWKAFETVYQVPVLHRLYHGECVDYLRKRGVGPMVYSNYAHKQGIAGPMNLWNRQILDSTEDVYCFAAFHPDDPDAMEYTEKILDHPKVMGVKLHFLIQTFYPHDRRLYPLYEKILEKGKRLLMHIGTGPIGSNFTGVDFFKNVLADFPDLPANIPHMGGYEYRAFMNLLDAHNNLYLDTSYSFWPQFPGSFDLPNGFLEDHRDRILYGSDFPNIILPREDEIEGLLARNLSQEFYDRVFYENGQRLIREVCEAQRVC